MPSVQALGPGQGSGGAGDAAFLEAVLPQPQLVDARGISRLGYGAQFLRCSLRAEGDAETGHSRNVLARPDTATPVNATASINASRVMKAVV